VNQIEDRLEKLLKNSDPDDRDAINVAIKALDEKQALEISLFDLRGKNAYADYFIVCHGRSDRQVSALFDVAHEVLKKNGHRAIGFEGEGLCHWVLMDYGNLIINIFYEPTRRFYNLDGLWPDCEAIRGEEMTDLLAKRKAAEEQA